MRSMGNSIGHPYAVPWISWHEYILAGGLNTLIFEQRTHRYYWLTGEAAVAWHRLHSGISDGSAIDASLAALVRDGILVNCPKPAPECHDDRPRTVHKYSRIPETIHRRIKKDGYVFDAHWDITNKCNEKCIHCYNAGTHDGRRNRQRDELSFDEAKRLVDDLSFLGVFRLVLSGGEVLTKDCFIPLCRYIRQHHMQLIVYTNGFAFTDRLLQDLADLNPSTVCFSVYGDSDSVHDSITRVKGSYGKVLHALSYFKEHGIETCHKNTLLTENVHCWRETLSKGEALSNHSLVNCTIYPSMDSGSISVHALTEPQLLELALSPDSPIYCQREIRGACNIHRKKTETPCYHQTNTIYINPKGEISPCIAFPCVVAGLREGNIPELKRKHKASSFKPDFSGMSGIERLDNWRALSIADLKECGRYDYCEFCIDVCPGDAFLLKGDLLAAPDNHCIIAKARFKAYQASHPDSPE